MGALTAETTASVVNTLLGSTQNHEEKEFQKLSTLKSDNHVLHFNHLPPYMIQDILDLLKHCKINDWTIDNKDKDTILSFQPEVSSSVDVFYDNLTGYQIKYNRMAI
jgi:hypothetical protein